jgi:precorrin-2 dehydrogenase/sirohydrochlorin ferrochelatase
MSIAGSYLIGYNAFVKTYPISLIGLERRHAVVVGGGNVAARKVGDLLDADARVTVISPTLVPALKALAEAGQIRVIGRPYQNGDLSSAFLVIAATDDPNVNQMVWQEAEQCDCLLNVVDEPSLCHFISPATVRRGDITITISTGGTSPALARRLRERLETLIGPEYGELATLLAELRPELKLRYTDDSERQQAAFRLVDSDLARIIKQKGLEEARVKAWELLTEGSE